MNFLQQYNDIMQRYKNGEFGENHLSVYDILMEAGYPDLLEKMNVSEVEYLYNHSTGLLRKMYSLVEEQKKEKLASILVLEKELESYHLESYCEGDIFSDETLAKRLQLDVQYCNSNELPVNVEATLSPSKDNHFFGLIRILKDSVTRFSYMHELIHYFRDVGVGNRVLCEYTRKKKGKTDSEKEQEINYLTAAAVMPFEQIQSDLEAFEEHESDSQFWIKMCNKYGQNKDALFRRFIEVRCIIDYRKNFC